MEQLICAGTPSYNRKDWDAELLDASGALYTDSAESIEVQQARLQAVLHQAESVELQGRHAPKLTVEIAQRVLACIAADRANGKDQLLGEMLREFCPPL